MNLEERNSRRRARYAEDPSKALERVRKWRLANPDHNKNYMREQRQGLLGEVIAAYGGACVCCGEKSPMFLTIDHIFNDGAKHQRSLGLVGRAGVHIYRELKRLGYPKDRYRLLCFNCNCGRARNGGTCPHKES